MIISDETRLKAEIDHVQRMLAELPQEAAIGKLSLSSRLEELKKELAALPYSLEPVSAKLTFRGRPVVASHGIFADFAAKATSAFSDLVAALAAGRDKVIARSGPIPNRDQSRLLITGTATGSFGFVLEEEPGQGRFSGLDSKLGQAIDEATSLIDSVSSDDDEELAERISQVSRRTIVQLRMFLKELFDNDAVCTLSFRDRESGFRDANELKTALDRIAEGNVHEEVETYSGSFQGVLPNSRSFEFLTEPDDILIRGKVGSEVSDPDEINNYLHKPLKIRLKAFRLGSGRARYVLEETPSWESHT